jgi:hypothetical protein
MSYPSNFVYITGMTMKEVEQACPDNWSLSQIWKCRYGIKCRTVGCYYFHIHDGVIETPNRVVETPDGACKYYFYNGSCTWNYKKKQNPNNPRIKPCKHSIHICQGDYIEQIEEKIKWEKENKIDNEVIQIEDVVEVVVEDVVEVVVEVVDNKDDSDDDSDGYDSVEVVDTDDEENEVDLPPNDIAKKLAPSPEVIWEKCPWLDKYEEQ